MTALFATRSQGDTVRHPIRWHSLHPALALLGQRGLDAAAARLLLARVDYRTVNFARQTRIPLAGAEVFRLFVSILSACGQTAVSPYRLATIVGRLLEKLACSHPLRIEWTFHARIVADQYSVRLNIRRSGTGLPPAGRGVVRSTLSRDASARRRRSVPDFQAVAVKKPIDTLCA
jgi:hypothetical protein